MGEKKYFVAHGHVYLDMNDNCNVCPLCGDGNFFLECLACGEDEDDVDLLVVDLSKQVNFNDNEISDDPVERDEFETMPLVFDTEDRTTNKPMVIKPEETDGDDELESDNDNNSDMMVLYSPPIPLTLSFSPLNNLAEEKKKRKQIILRKRATGIMRDNDREKKVERFPSKKATGIMRDNDREKKVERFPSKIPTFFMSNPITFSKNELKRDNKSDLTSRFPSKLRIFSSRNLAGRIEVRHGYGDRTTWSKPSCAFDIIETRSCRRRRIF